MLSDITFRQVRNSALAVLIGLSFAGCSSTAFDTSSTESAARQAVAGSTDAIACQGSDTQVKSQSQCLQDDAACYELPNGNWCTGPRALSCPNGSEALNVGEACPSGSKCFEYSAGLQCMMRYK